MSKSIEELQEEIDELTQIIDDHNNELVTTKNAAMTELCLKWKARLSTLSRLDITINIQQDTYQATT